MFTEIDLAVACLNPKVIEIAKNNIKYLNNKYKDIEIISKLLSLIDSQYLSITNLPPDSKGISDTQFDAALMSLNLGESTNKVISASYQKCLNYTDDEIHAIKSTLSEIITNEVINISKLKHMDSPVDFVKSIKEFNVDNIVEIDKKIYRESCFTDINVDALEEEINNGGVLKSSFPMINACSSLGGYVDRTLTAISGKPGCFTGDTKVLMIDGTYKTMEELYNSKAKNIEVYSYDPDLNKTTIVTADECVLTKYVNTLIRVHLHNGVYFDCTPDHLILVEGIGYVQASKLTSGSKLQSTFFTGYKEFGEPSIDDKVRSGNYVKHIEIIITKDIPVYDLVNAGRYHNFAIYVYDPESNNNMGVFVHNSGKSFFSLQEALNFCAQGKKVLYLALGDMNEFHFIVRACAILLKRSLNEITVRFKYYYGLVLAQYPYLANLKVQYFLPDQVSCSEWLSFIKSQGYYDDYDVFFVDYDTNFKSESDMYYKGEETYNALKALADRPGKFVFVCCQPKECYYSEEIIPMQAMAESSRKPQICDNIITISQPPSPGNVNHIGIINVAKYRGGSPASCPYLMDKNGRFEAITIEMYNYLKVTRDSITLSGSGCESTSKVLTPELLQESVMVKK